MSEISSKDKSSPPSEGDKSSPPISEAKDVDNTTTSASSSEGEVSATTSEHGQDAPLLPAEDAPPLPNELPPDKVEDDGWEPVWDDRAQAFYFYNHLTNITQWENPRVPPTSAQPGPPGVGNYDRLSVAQDEAWVARPVAGGYDPSIHGDYDPDADYAKVHEPSAQDANLPGAPGTDPSQMYAATGAFNRFTGKWQQADLNPEKFNDENKSRRQMNAFFDVDAAANSHDGKSLKAERAGKKLTKKELQAFKDKRREKKEEKRRAWLRD